MKRVEVPAFGLVLCLVGCGGGDWGTIGPPAATTPETADARELPGTFDALRVPDPAIATGAPGVLGDPEIPASLVRPASDVPTAVLEERPDALDPLTDDPAAMPFAPPMPSVESTAQPDDVPDANDDGDGDGTTPERSASLEPASEASVMDAAAAADPRSLLQVRRRLDAMDPALARAPDERIPVRRDDLGVWIVQASSADRFGVPHGAATHFYSRRQAWNADETLLLIGDRLVDARTLDVLPVRVRVSTARNWSHVDPERVLGMAAPDGPVNVLGWWNVRTDAFERILTLSDHERCRFGGGEGSVSRDDRWLLVDCERGDGPSDLLLIDVERGEIVARRDAEWDFNWASVSPLGRHVLVENSWPGREDRELIRYDMGFGSRQRLTRSPEHGDLCVDADGRELFVMIDGEGLRAVRLDDGASIGIAPGLLTVPADFGHVSCRNTGRPGWAYFSAGDGGWIGALELRHSTAEPGDGDGDEVPRGTFDGRIELWTVHGSTSSSYEAVPKVSSSPSGRQIVYTTDWQGASETVDVLVTPIDGGALWPDCLVAGSDRGDHDACARSGS